MAAACSHFHAAPPLRSIGATADTLAALGGLVGIRRSWTLFEPKAPPARLEHAELPAGVASAVVPGAGIDAAALLAGLLGDADGTGGDADARPQLVRPVNAMRYLYPTAAEWLPDVRSHAAALQSRARLDFLRVLFGGPPVGAPPSADRDALKLAFNRMWPVFHPDRIPARTATPLILPLATRPGAAAALRTLLHHLAAVDHIGDSLLVVVAHGEDELADLATALDDAAFVRSYLFLLPATLTAATLAADPPAADPHTLATLYGMRIVHDVLGYPAAAGLSLDLVPGPAFYAAATGLAPYAAGPDAAAVDLLPRGRTVSCTHAAACAAAAGSLYVLEDDSPFALAKSDASLGGVVWSRAQYVNMAAAALATPGGLAVTPAHLFASVLAAADASVLVSCGAYAETATHTFGGVVDSFAPGARVSEVGGGEVRAGELAGGAPRWTCEVDGRAPSPVPSRDGRKAEATAAFWDAKGGFVTDGVAQQKESGQCGATSGNAKSPALTGMRSAVGDKERVVEAEVVELSWPGIEPALPPELADVGIGGVGTDLRALVEGREALTMAAAWAEGGRVDVVDEALHDTSKVRGLRRGMIKAAWNSAWPVINADVVPAAWHVPIFLRVFKRTNALPMFTKLLADVERHEESVLFVSIDGEENVDAFVELLLSVTSVRIYVFLHSYDVDNAVLGLHKLNQYRPEQGGQQTGGARYARNCMHMLFVKRILYNVLDYPLVLFTADDVMLGPDYYRYHTSLVSLYEVDPELYTVFAYPHGIEHDCKHIASKLKNTGSCRVSDTGTLFVETEYYVDWGNSFKRDVFYATFDALLGTSLDESYDVVMYGLMGSKHAVGPCSHRSQYLTGIMGMSGASGARWDTGLPMIAHPENTPGRTFGDVFRFHADSNPELYAKYRDVVLGSWRDDGRRGSPSFDVCAYVA